MFQEVDQSAIFDVICRVVVLGHLESARACACDRRVKVIGILSIATKVAVYFLLVVLRSVQSTGSKTEVLCCKGLRTIFK